MAANGVSADTTAQFTTAGPRQGHRGAGRRAAEVGRKHHSSVALLRTRSRQPTTGGGLLSRHERGCALGFSRVTLADNGLSTAMFNVDTTAGPVAVTVSVGGVTGTARVDVRP